MKDRNSQDASRVKDEDALSYEIIKLTGCKLGMLLNFNEWRMADGIKRIVLNL